MNYGYLEFRSDAVKAAFLSLSKLELNEFENDLAKLLIKIKEEMIKARSFEGRAVANQRFGKRCFYAEWLIQIEPNKEVMLILDVFNELEIDDYLDSVNANKTLNDKGYINLNL